MNAAATGSRQQPFSPLVAQFQFHTSDEQEDPRTPNHSQSHSACHKKYHSQANSLPLANVQQCNVTLRLTLNSISNSIEAPKISYHIILYHKFVIVTKALVYGGDI